MSFRISSWAAAPLNTKRREPRPRLTAIDCGEPSPRLKPDGLMRRRPAAATPSGLGAVASARKPRVARTRTRGEPHVDGTKTLRGFSRSLDSVLSQGFAQGRGGSSRRSVAQHETIDMGSRLSGEGLTRRRGDTEFLRGVRLRTDRTVDFSFLRASVTPCETSPVSSLLRMSTKRRAAGVSLFVDRREADPLSCRTAGARSCRRGRENPKGEDAEAMPGENEVFSPGGASVASAAQRAVSRRRRFVFARSAAPLHDVSATLNNAVGSPALCLETKTIINHKITRSDH